MKSKLSFSTWFTSTSIFSIIKDHPSHCKESASWPSNRKSITNRARRFCMRMRNLSMWVIQTKDELKKFKMKGKVNWYWLKNSIVYAKFYLMELIKPEFKISFRFNYLALMIDRNIELFINSIKANWLWKDEKYWDRNTVSYVQRKEYRM